MSQAPTESVTVKMHDRHMTLEQTAQDQSGGTILKQGVAVSLHNLQNALVWWETTRSLSRHQQKCFRHTVLTFHCFHLPEKASKDKNWKHTALMRKLTQVYDKKTTTKTAKMWL